MRQAQATPRPSRHPIQHKHHLHSTSPIETTTPPREIQEKANLKGENDLLEVVFEGATEAEQLDLMDELNRSFHSIVRESGGNNADRLLLMPTLGDDAERQERMDSLLATMQSLNDSRLIASVGRPTRPRLHQARRRRAGRTAEVLRGDRSRGARQRRDPQLLGLLHQPPDVRTS
jgi:hypothetical protein